jgi:hypothetical protein
MNSRFFVGICVSRHPVKKYSVNMAKQNMAIKQILLLSLQFYESKAAFRHILPSHEPGNGVSNLHKRKPWCLFRIHSLCLANQTPLLEPESWITQSTESSGDSCKPSLATDFNVPCGSSTTCHHTWTIAAMDQNAPESRAIALAAMPQQFGVRTVGDDWTGVIDRKERRKLQNRLNQRRYRACHKFQYRKIS